MVEVHSHIPSVTLVSPALLMTEGVPNRHASFAFLVGTFAQEQPPMSGLNGAKLMRPD